MSSEDLSKTSICVVEPKKKRRKTVNSFVTNGILHFFFHRNSVYQNHEMTPQSTQSLQKMKQNQLTRRQ